MTQPMTKASDNLVERLDFLTKTEPCRNIGAVHDAKERIETLTAALLEAGEALGEVTEALAQCYIENYRAANGLIPR